MTNEPVYTPGRPAFRREDSREGHAVMVNAAAGSYDPWQMRRRLKAVRMSAELFAAMLAGSPPGRHFRVETGLPADVQEVRVFLDPTTDVFVAVYRHPSFDVVPDDRPPPVVEARMTCIDLTEDPDTFRKIEGLPPVPTPPRGS